VAYVTDLPIAFLKIRGAQTVPTINFGVSGSNKDY